MISQRILILEESFEKFKDSNYFELMERLKYLEEETEEKKDETLNSSTFFSEELEKKVSALKTRIIQYEGKLIGFDMKISKFKDVINKNGVKFNEVRDALYLFATCTKYYNNDYTVWDSGAVRNVIERICIGVKSINE